MVSYITHLCNLSYVQGTPEEISMQIRKWFTEDKIPIVKKDVQDIDFGLQVNLGDMPIHIFKLKDRNDSIVVYGAIDLARKYAKKLLSRPRVKDSFYELELKFLELGLEYNFKPTGENVQLIEVLQVIHYDGLTKNELMRTFVRVRNIMLWTAKKLGRVGMVTKSHHADIYK